MGIHDRDYYRPEPGVSREYYRIQPQQSWVFAILVVNVMVFFANAIRGEDQINSMLCMTSTTLSHPTEWWKLVTCAFAHNGFWHIFGNMFALFIFGPLVERKYGPIEFMCFYFLTAILGAVVWGTWNWNIVLVDKFDRVIGPLSMLGASGAVCGVVMLVICNYPRMPIYLWGILEMPMWLFGVIFIAMDVFGFFGLNGGDRVAHEVHLAGLGFGALYCRLKWRISDFLLLFTPRFWQKRQKRKRFFNPKNAADRYNRGLDGEDDAASDQSEEAERRSEQVDAILQKISEKGQDSLTWNERRILKRASREMQKKNKPK